MEALELERGLDRLVERDHVPQVRRRVVGVAGVVHLAALAHDEESGGVVEELDALGHDLGKRRLRFVAVDRELHPPVAEDAPCLASGPERRPFGILL